MIVDESLEEMCVSQQQSLLEKKIQQNYILGKTFQILFFIRIISELCKVSVKECL